jgi:hypothetical protein
VRLVAPVVLGAETPVHVWEDGLLFEVYCAKDTAAYFRFPSVNVESREKRDLSAFSTFLAKKHGDFYTLQVRLMDNALKLLPLRLNRKTSK